MSKMTLREILEARAQEKGLSIREVIEQDRASLREMTAPGPDCLKPEEILVHISSGELLRGDRKLHFNSCQYCQELLEETKLARPSVAESNEMGKSLAGE